MDRWIERNAHVSMSQCLNDRSNVLSLLSSQRQVALIEFLRPERMSMLCSITIRHGGGDDDMMRGRGRVETEKKRRARIHYFGFVRHRSR